MTYTVGSPSGGPAQDVDQVRGLVPEDGADRAPGTGIVPRDAGPPDWSWKPRTRVPARDTYSTGSSRAARVQAHAGRRAPRHRRPGRARRACAASSSTAPVRAPPTATTRPVLELDAGERPVVDAVLDRSRRVASSRYARDDDRRPRPRAQQRADAVGIVEQRVREQQGGGVGSGDLRRAARRPAARTAARRRATAPGTVRGRP